jgi:Uma2 family endonuclease
MAGTLPDSALTWPDVLRMWHELDVPEGWRPEISPEGIVMTPPPSGLHNLIGAVVNRALVAATGDHLEIFQTLGVAVPSIGGIFIPDLCVVARHQVPPGSDPVAAEHVVLAVEITSPSNARHDRKRKKWAYAHGPVAHYLLIDAFDEDGPSISLFSNPVDGAYRDAIRTAFGQTVKLPPPLELELDTSTFPADG